MKKLPTLVIQIPCLNEEQTLPAVIQSIPTKIKGIGTIITMIIDDGSTDETVEIARSLGVSEIITHPTNRGLAAAFESGVNRALELGADILVNTDGDNQYPQQDIERLVQPILNGTAEVVIADRQTHTIEHFSPLKKLLQRVGSWVVNKAAGTDVPDAVSGFRAYSKNALLKINTVSRFSYATETIIQLGAKGVAITSIPIVTNPKTRESRLFASTFEHVRKSASTIIKAYIMYRPAALFVTLSILLGIAGLVPFVRYLILLALDTSGPHLQSLLLGTVLLVGSFLCIVLSVVADLIRTNRVLIEASLEHLKQIRYK